MLSKLVKGASLAAAVAIAAPTVTGNANAADELNFVGWGGAIGEAQQQAFFESFTEATGIKVNELNYSGGLAQVRAQMETGNVNWDIVDMNVPEAVAGCDEGILAPIDINSLPPAPDGTPASEDFFEGTYVECGVGQNVWSNVIAYDANVLTDEKPQSIGDFFDLEKFPGKRGLYRAPNANMEWALMADGVPASKVYDVLETEEGTRRAFAVLDTIKDHVVWWEAGAQAPQLLADSEVVMTSAYNGRIYNAQKNEGKNFEILWDGHVWDVSVFGIVAGTPRKDAAFKFVHYVTQPKVMPRLSDHISYGPVRKSAMQFVEPDVKPHLPTSHLENSLQVDPNFWADNQDRLSQRFSAWLAQ